VTASKTSLPSAGRLEHYIAYGVLGAAMVAVVVTIALVVCRRRGSREPIPLREYTIVHTPWSRLRNMAWAVATTVACLLVKRALDADHEAGGIVQVIRAVLEALRPGTF
jgi:hypothetical protein